MYLYKQTFSKMLKFLDHNIFVCGVLSCTTLRYDDILNVAWKSDRLKTFCVWGFFVTLTFFNVEIFLYWRTRCSVTGRFLMMTLCFSGCFMKECFFMWALCHKTLINKNVSLCGRCAIRHLLISVVYRYSMTKSLLH